MLKTPFFHISILLSIVFILAGKQVNASSRESDKGRDSLTVPRIAIRTTGSAEDSSSCIIPFSRAGNLILVQAKIDTTEGNFILDTGAPNLILNITYFRGYTITVAADEDQGSAAGSSATVSRTTVAKLSLGNIIYNNVNADLTNLGNIENTKGVKILGLLGMQLFRQCELIIDYEKNLLHLHWIGKKEMNTYRHAMLADTSTYNTLPIDIIDNKIITRSEMAGRKLRLMIDCGAESNVLDSRLPNKIFENVTISRRVMLNGSGNEKVEALYGDLRHLKVGDKDISTLPVLITNLEKTCLSYASCIDGILGFDFLSLHKIGFNFVKRKMYIWK